MIPLYRNWPPNLVPPPIKEKLHNLRIAFHSKVTSVSTKKPAIGHTIFTKVLSSFVT